jgi:hypothetical protein
MPRPQLYKHFQNRQPTPPTDEDGKTLPWQSAYVSNRNPAFVYLEQALGDGTVDYYQKAHLVYNSNPALWCIKPRAFPVFFQKTVKKVLQIDINVDPYTDDNEAATTADDEATTEAATTAAAADDDDEDDDEDDDDEATTEDTTSKTSSGKESNSLSLPSNSVPTMNFATGSSMPKDDKGTVCHADEFIPYESNSGNHSQMHLPHRIDKRSDGPTVVLTPLVGMTADNTMLRPSSTCDRTILIIRKQGPSADPKKVKKSLTRGTHTISNKKNPAVSLRLDPHDTFVTGALTSVNDLHGQHVSDITSSSDVMAIKFDRPIEPKVVDVDATNGHKLPGMYDMIPQLSTSKKDGIHQLVFSLQWADLGDVELNYSSDDSG